MKTESLNGIWKCTLPNGLIKDVKVPGCVEQVWDNWGNSGPFVYVTSFHYSGDGNVRLDFGGVSYFCQVALNDIEIGTHEGIWDCFVLDCCGAIQKGNNILKVTVTKPGYSIQDAFPLRSVLSGFIPDVLTTFGGIWDDVQLLHANTLFVYNHHCKGNCDGSGIAAFEIETTQSGVLECELLVTGLDQEEVFRKNTTFQIIKGKQELSVAFYVPEAKLWELDNPSLYHYDLSLTLKGDTHQVTGQFGFREVTTSGRHLLLNGKAVYMRGILHWGYYDDLIIPNPDDKTIREELRKMKEYGFNAVKHCLYIPRKRYFQLMDELGMLAWIELPLWLPEANPELEHRIKREYPRILSDLSGHPSICLLSLGCELDDTVRAEMLEEMYSLAKQETGALVRDNSGSGECYGGLTVDYADFYDYHFYAELPHLEQLIEHFTPFWRKERPWVFGEFCDSDTMRDLWTVRKGKDRDVLHWEKDNALLNPISLLKPDFYLGDYDRRMEEHGIRQEIALIGSLSRDHSLTHRKVTMELTRSYPEICGYNVTSIRDVPIATSGMLDDLGQAKFPTEIFRCFNSNAALLQTWDLSRTWVEGDRVLPNERYNFTCGSVFSTHILLSNYTGKDLSGCVFSFRLACGGNVVTEGQESVSRSLPHAQVAEVAYLNFVLPKVCKPETLVLEVFLHENGCLIASNDFPIFVYPESQEEPCFFIYDPVNSLDGLTRRLKSAEHIQETKIRSLGGEVLLSSVFTEEVKLFIERGGRLILLQPSGGYLPVWHGPMWREGMIRPYEHPILEGIQKSVWYDDLRYFSMTVDTSIDSRALEEMGAKEIVPVLRRYDCRRWTATDYICTFRLGKGLCAATTLRLGGGLGKTPLYAKQNPFAGYLLRNMIEYLRNN